jgi:endonuclease/exonuclease/phosphatase family metal-dependent hydrolase
MRQLAKTASIYFMKILSWNIRHGGGSRVIRIQSIIAAHKPDILILSEFRLRATSRSASGGTFPPLINRSS